LVESSILRPVRIMPTQTRLPNFIVSHPPVDYNT
jgi:hypothetical protein